MDKRIFNTKEDLLKSLTEEVVNAHLNSDLLLWDQVADSAEEKEAIKQIKSHIKDIEGLLVSVKTEAGKKTISDRIKKSKIKELIKE